MTYKGYTILKSGFNYSVPELEGNELAANIATAKKWIDTELASIRPRVPYLEEQEQIAKVESKPIFPPLAIQACIALVTAYNRGARNSGSVDWDDVDNAHRLAREALAQYRKGLRTGKVKP